MSETSVLNNPLKYTDPSGNLWYALPSVSWSYYGGLSVGVGAGFGFPSGISVGVGVNYGFKNNNWTFTANTSLAGFYAYGGYDTKAGWIGGAGFGLSPAFTGNFGVSSNLFSVGFNYSQNGGWSASALGFSYSNQGLIFDPSITVSINLKFGQEIFEKVSDEQNNNKTNEGHFEFPTDYELNQFVEKYIKKSDYNILELTAYKDNFQAYEGKNPESIYIREKNGIIYKYSTTKIEKPVRIDGVTFSRYNGLKCYSYIYMSRISNRFDFITTLNHEITHAYINTLNYRKKMDSKSFKRFTESSAYYVSDGGVPHYHHAEYYNGIFPIVVPPRIIPVPNF